MSDESLVRVTIDDGDGNDAPRLRSRDGMRSDTASAAEAAAVLERQESYRRVAAAEAQQVEAYAVATRAEGDLAERDFKLSFESGDVNGMADAQRRLASSEARTLRLEELATNLKTAPAAPLDPVEAYIRPRTAPTQAWLRKHVEFITDRTKNAKLTAAHYDALANEITVDTPQYFAHVERYIGARGGNGGSGIRRVSSAAAAGVNEHDYNTHDLGRGGVVLTAGERRRATDGTLIWNYGPYRGEPIGLQEYARRKRIMIAQGQYKKLED